MAKITASIIHDAGFGRVIAAPRIDIPSVEPTRRDTEPVRESRPAHVESGIDPGFTVIDPGAIDGTGATDNGNQPKRRGRPAGSKNRTQAPVIQTQAETNLRLESIEGMVFSIHMMAAASFGIAELALSKDESKELSKAGLEVLKHYAVNVDPKKLAWMNLLSCAGMIYGTRAIAIYRNTGKRPGPVAVPKPSPQPVQMPNPSRAENAGPGFSIGHSPTATSSRGKSMADVLNPTSKPWSEVSPSELWNEQPGETLGSL